MWSSVVKGGQGIDDYRGVGVARVAIGIPDCYRMRALMWKKCEKVIIFLPNFFFLSTFLVFQKKKTGKKSMDPLHI